MPASMRNDAGKGLTRRAPVDQYGCRSRSASSSAARCPRSEIFFQLFPATSRRGRLHSCMTPMGTPRPLQRLSRPMALERTVRTAPHAERERGVRGARTAEGRPDSPRRAVVRGSELLSPDRCPKSLATRSAGSLRPSSRKSAASTASSVMPAACSQVSAPSRARFR
jgi:hypothetical protein